MAYNSRFQPPKPKCNQCGSEELKKRKNYSHGNKGKGKTSYECKKCSSTDILIMTQTRRRR